MEELIVSTPTQEEEQLPLVEDTNPQTPQETVGEESVTDAPQEEAPQVDYAAMAASDLTQIRALFPSMGALEHLSEIPNAMRYAALRDAGLTVEEAFWAACHTAVAKQPSYDNRSHLRSSVPRGAAGNPMMMTASEMAAAKELFGDLTESEIQTLYNKCRS